MTFHEQLRQKCDDAHAAHKATLQALDSLRSAGDRYSNADRDLKQTTKLALEVSINALNRYEILTAFILSAAFFKIEAPAEPAAEQTVERGGAA